MSRLPDRVNGKLPKYTSIGCYALFYYTKHNDILCADCATQASFHSAECVALADNTARETECICTTSLDEPATDCAVNWEDPDMYCDECSERIESAYAELE